MARSSKTLPAKQPAKLSPKQLRDGIKLLERRIADLEIFDSDSVMDQFNIPQLDQLKNSIETTLVDVFGHDTLDYDRYAGATWFNTGSVSLSLDGRRTPISEVRDNVRKSKENAILILQGAVAHLILNELANAGRTLIEKIEAHSGVGFAIILLTPDDKCEIEGQLEGRARQNVIWEYGYFVGLLGRERVCVLKRDEVKIPSDLEGIGWTSFDASGKWKIELARELKSAAYSIDMNKAFD
jgi:hypothetical protein